MSDRHPAFAPLHGGDAPPAVRKASTKPSPTDGLSIVMPVPDDAPVPPASLKGLGVLSRRETYRDAAGRVIGHICRFDRADGTKSFRPATLWRAADGALRWLWQGWPDPRPLYGLDRLAARPGAPVLLCEGEKAADAAAQLAPDHVGVTSPNGSKSAGKADWSPLRGRRVVLWPDADAPGEAYATEAASLILAAGAVSVSRLTPPSGAAAGWDAGDALAEGWGLERTAAFLATAQAVARPAAATALEAEPPVKAAPARPSPPDDEGDGKRGRGRPSWHDILTEITSDFALWHSPRKIAFATVTMPDGHRENMALRSDAFLRLLRLRAHEKTERPAPKSNLEDMVALLEAQAIAHGEEREEWLRVGRRDGALYVDLGCRQWRAVEITPGGVRILTSHALPFVRSEGMLALPEPEFGSERGIDELRDFVNAESDGDFKLIAAWTLYALCGSKEYPLLVLNGEQGTGKSTLTRTLASLVDPHELDIMAPPEEVEDLFVIAKHAHLLPIDNLSKLDGTMSDALCRIATGGTSAVRTLFSNAGLTLLKAARPVLLNGIPSLTDRPDLAQRTVTVRLRPIPEEERKVADDMAARWQEVRPRVLGTLFEAISRGLRDAPTIRLERLPRMAGFARFVAACAPGLGFDRDELLAAYAANQAELADNAFENNPVATAIAAMMEQVGNAWEGTPTDLYEALCAPDITSERVRASFAWPKSAQSLSTQITRVAPALRARGIDTERKHSGKTYWLIRKL